MEIYTIPIFTGDSSVGPIEVELGGPGHSSPVKTAAIGDIVLGIISLTGGPEGFWGPGQDFSGDFSSVVTQSSTTPANSVLIQNVQMRGGSPINASGIALLALMQRGNLQT